MLNDIGTVVWKEWKELIARTTQSRSDTMKTIVVLSVILGIIVWRGSFIMNTMGALLFPSFILIQMLAGLMVVTLVLGLVSSVLRNVGAQSRPSLGTIATALGFYLLLCLAMSCAAVLVSLRAPTVRQAIQTLTWSFMIVFFLVIFGIARIPPEWRATLARVLAGENLLRTEIVVAGILLGLIFVLFGAARLRFQRARLILD